MSFISDFSMAPNYRRILPVWVEIWLFLSALICMLDVGFTMLRPHTTTGELSTIYAGWNLYASVDKRYADTDDHVTCATGRVMLIEIVMNVIALIMARLRSRHTVLTAFTSTAFVFWKTVWFLTLYVLPPVGTPSYFTEDSSNMDIFLIFWIPNGVWIVVPFLVMIALWNRLAIPFEVEQNYRRRLESTKQSVIEPITLTRTTDYSY